MGFLTKNDVIKVKEIDSSVKNKFSFTWLERTVDSGDGILVQIGSDIAKIDVAGHAVCKLCNKQINYGNRGAVALEDHVKSSKHKGLLKQKRSNHQIDKLINQYKDDPCGNSATTHHCQGPAFKLNSQTEQPLVPMCDRISNAEAAVLGVMAEYSMPMSYAPVLINLSKALAHDPKALAELHMDRTTAAYKMTHGLAESFHQKLISKLQRQPFSLNLDESTANNNKKVLTILVSYYDVLEEKVLVEHWCSLEVVKANSESLYNEIVKLIDGNQIPWENLVSVLMDSCAVMRGKKSGVEQRIREQKAPHLLDIDGDSVHHLHNSSKRLCAPFSNYLEDLFNDLHTDFKYSQDLLAYLSEICAILGVTYSVPERFVPHRWLSAYDISLNTSVLMDAYLVFYFGFLNREDKMTYHDIVKEIYKNKEVSFESKERIGEIHTMLTSKKMTNDGKNRKQRITQKLFYTDTSTKLQLSFYMAVLQILKKYVCVFQSSNTMVHQLHDAQFGTYKEFLACFLKPEIVAPLSPKMLKNLDLECDTNQFLKLSSMFIGAEAEKMIKEVGKNDSCADTFLNQAATGYIQCAQHMQKTLPLNSPTLKALSCIDPLIRSHSVGTKQFKRLSTEYMAHILDEDELSIVSGEINRYSVDHNLPTVNEDSGTQDVVQWWSSINKSGKYPVLCKVAFAALSVFHGPLVESSFNIMGDIIDPKSANTKVETYSAIQTVKYTFKARQTTALRYFERKDVRHSKVDRHICINLRSAAMRYKKLKQERQQRKVEKLNKLKVKHTFVKSKQQMKNKLKEASEMKYESHIQRETMRAKRRLTAIAAKRATCKPQMKNNDTEEYKKKSEHHDKTESLRAKKRMIDEKLTALAAKRKKQS